MIVTKIRKIVRINFHYHHCEMKQYFIQSQRFRTSVTCVSPRNYSCFYANCVQSIITILRVNDNVVYGNNHFLRDKESIVV